MNRISSGWSCVLPQNGSAVLKFCKYLQCGRCPPWQAVAYQRGEIGNDRASKREANPRDFACVFISGRPRRALQEERKERMKIHWGFKMLVLVVLAFVGIVSRAQADAITWTLVNVTSLGSTITGSFVFDADTSTYSAIGITTSGGSIIPNETWTNWVGFGASYGPAISCCLGVVDTTLTNQTGANLLNLIFMTGLTDAGGTIPISSTQQGTCNDANCNSFTPYATNPSGTNSDVTGYVVSSTPEPGTLMLLATGLLGLLRKTGTRRFLTP
jgi:PEP-CTERM motif-containing protein